MNNEISANSSHNPLILNINAREGRGKEPKKSSHIPACLITKLKRITSSSAQLSHHPKNKTPGEHLSHRWRSLWPFNSDPAVSLHDEGEGISLTEILTEGEYSRRQAHSLQNPSGEQTSHCEWQGSYLKRCLVGVGLLTGAGIIGGLGVRYNNGKGDCTESQRNLILPGLTPPHPNPIPFCPDLPMNADKKATPSEIFMIRNCEYNLEMDFIHNVVTQSLNFIPGFNKSNRNKRSIPVNNRYIPNLILEISQNKEFDWRVRNEFDLIFRKADASPEVKNSKSSEEKHIKLLLKIIQITQQCIAENKYGHARHKAFESFVYFLNKLWAIANTLPDTYSQYVVKKFKEIYGDISRPIEARKSPYVSHGSPIAEARVMDDNATEVKSIGAEAVAGGLILGSGLAGCAGCVKGAVNIGSGAVSSIRGAASSAGSLAGGIGGIASAAAGIVGKGSISTVYDTGNGYVEKKYTGHFDENKKSRLISANNNAKGFNRLYGQGAATVSITHENGAASVSVTLKKIEGQALAGIDTISNENILNEIASAIENDDPASRLAHHLRDNGIVHHDINKGNIIYNNQEFFVLDFDSANILPEGQIVSPSQTETMRLEFAHVFSDVLRNIKLKLNRPRVISLQNRGGITADKIMEKMHEAEWNPRNINPSKVDIEIDESPQFQLGSGTQRGEKINVEAGGIATVTDPVTILSTSGLSDCSALIVLTGWNGVFYTGRTLVHLSGSNFSYSLKYGADASGLIYELQDKLIQGGKVILIGGDYSVTNTGFAIIIGQTNHLGVKPLLELINTPDVALDMAGSSQVNVYPDGTFNLGDDEGERGVLTPEEINHILFHLIDG